MQRRPGAAPYSLLSNHKRASVRIKNKGSKNVEPRLSDCNCFCLASLPRGLSFAFEIPESQSFIAGFTGLLAEESTASWRMKAGDPFSNNRMMMLLYAQKKKSLVASKGKLMSHTCIKHLNMCSKSR